MEVEELGSGPRIVLVHGSVTPGWMTWSRQRVLARDFTLVVPIRTGYPPTRTLDRIDFEEQAAELRALLRPGDHLVGHPASPWFQRGADGLPRAYEPESDPVTTWV